MRPLLDHYDLYMRVSYKFFLVVNKEVERGGQRTYNATSPLLNSLPFLFTACEPVCIKCYEQDRLMLTTMILNH